MDHFGTSAAIQGMVEVYYMTARQSGRTTSLVESLKDGDRVVCLTNQEARRLLDLSRERGITITAVALAPGRGRGIFHEGTSQGRTIFDHTWVEEHFRQAVRGAAEEIGYLQRELSGYGAAHRETARKARELATWHHWRPNDLKDPK